MRQCTRCGAEWKEGAKFCVKCGAAEERNLCPSCGAAVPNDSRFCTKCGYEMNIPTMQHFKNNITGSSKIVKYAIGAIVLLAIIIGIAIAVHSSSGSTGPNGTVISVKAKDMADDYIRDQASAETKYKDHKIAINGKVVDKFQFKNSNNYGIVIYQIDAAGKKYSVMVDVDPKLVKSLNGLNIGDFITVEGKSYGIVKQDNPTDITIQINAEKINE